MRYCCCAAMHSPKIELGLDGLNVLLQPLHTHLVLNAASAEVNAWISSILVS
jgi:hypothetical protein